jgi:hypothetical protein
MTRTAQMVLSDCQEALQDLAESGPDSTWRRRWICLLALLRAVGHVLHKVDAPADAKLAEIVAREYEKLKASRPIPEIYWWFIEDERNIALKEYKLRTVPYASATAASSLSVTDPMTGKLLTVAAKRAVDDLGFRVMVDGHYKGRLDMDVAAEAIAWWRQHLQNIEAQQYQ